MSSPKAKSTVKKKRKAAKKQDPLLGDKILVMLHKIYTELKLQNEYIQDNVKDDAPEMTELERNKFEKEMAEAQEDIDNIINPTATWQDDERRDF